MSITSSELKVIKILKKVKEAIEKATPEFNQRDVEEYAIAIEDSLIIGEENYDLSKHKTMLIPTEPIRSIPCKHIDPLNDISSALKFLKDNSISLLAFDGSAHNLGRHFNINLFVINVGYWYQNYGQNANNNAHGKGNDSNVLTESLTERDRRIKSKEFEYIVAEEVSTRLTGANKLILYDESFNMNYTLAWDIESRRKFTKLFEGHINKMLIKNFIPVGVFYTAARDIYRAYDALKNNVNAFKEEIPDKILMDKYLANGHRSNIFKVKTDALDGTNLDLRAFFIKLGDKNILRVEFPKQVEEFVDLIHCTVLAQLILGGGYPIALERAHEWAVLTSNDRELIEREAARLLGIPYPEMVYSKKLLHKRRPLV
ncbi:MAG: DNA double-strand break repair nuclease NurA [Candidatus Njordarchaeia archaeon]